MPLRDHKKPPFEHTRVLRAILALIPMNIIRNLNKQLPPEYRMEPNIRPENNIKIDIGSLDAMPEYETNVYDQFGLLVAAIELVSAANKDRPETRAEFSSKCALLWNNKICVSIVDLVPTGFNLYCDTLDKLGHEDPNFGPKSPGQYAVTLRARNGLPKNGWRLESWAYPAVTGERLPSVPVWLNDETHIMLDLDDVYEDALRDLRLG